MAQAQPIRSTDYKIARFGILNAQGQFWTPDTFVSEQEAIRHVRGFWRGSAADDFLKRAKIIPVTVTVEDARPTSPASEQALSE
jgi:hypothetical protein